MVGFTRLPNPNILPTGFGNAIACTRDGVYVAVAHTTTPRLTIYKRSGDVYTKLPNPTIPTGNGTAVAFSGNGVYLCVTHATTPYISIYKRSGDTFTKLPNVSPAIYRTAISCCLSFTGDRLILGLASSPFVYVFANVGDVYTSVSSPSNPPTAAVSTCAYSPDDVYLCLGQTAAPRLVFYKNSSGVLTRLAAPLSLPPGTPEGVAFSDFGDWLFVGNQSATNATAYKRSGDTWERITVTFSGSHGTMSTGAGLSSDGTIAGLSTFGYPYVVFFSRVGDEFIQQQNPATLPSYDGYSACLDASGFYFAASFYNSPYVIMYKGSIQPPVTNFSATPLWGWEPLVVQFADESTNNPTSWLWSFGDDTFSSEQNPLHTYADHGTYTVSLKATNAGGEDTEIKVGYITVLHPLPPTPEFSPLWSLQIGPL
jgi:PKD repeat protein